MPELARLEASGGVAELEGPEEVARLLEIGADGDNLVDQVFHADDAVLAEIVLDQLVVGESNALVIDLAISTLVDELAHRFERGISVGDPGLHDLDHLSGCLCQTHEHAVVNLEKTEKLKDLARLGRNLVDTAEILVLSRRAILHRDCCDLTL